MAFQLLSCLACSFILLTEGLLSALTLFLMYTAESFVLSGLVQPRLALDLLCSPAGLEFDTPVFSFPKCWDFRHMPLAQFYVVVGIEPRALCMLSRYSIYGDMSSVLLPCFFIFNFPPLGELAFFFSYGKMHTM